MSKKRWAIVLMTLSGIALVTHYSILLRLPEAVRIILVITKTVAYSLCFVCSFALCTRKRAHYAYYGLLLFQTFMLIKGVFSMYWVYQSIIDPMWYDRAPSILIAITEYPVQYIINSIGVILILFVFTMELPKVNWLMGTIALGNLTALFRFVLNRVIIKTWPLAVQKVESFNIKWIPLWIIGAIMLAIWELKGKEVQTAKEI